MQAEFALVLTRGGLVERRYMVSDYRWLKYKNKKNVERIIISHHMITKCFGFFSALNLDPDPDANTIARLFIFKRLFIFIS